MSKALKEAIEKNDAAAAKKALASVKDLERKLPGASAPLTYACERDADKVIAPLVAAGAKNKSKDGYVGFSPFVVAMRGGHVSVATELARLGVVTDEQVAHALMVTAQHGVEPSAAFLMEQFRPKVDVQMFRMAAIPKKAGMIRLFAKYGDVNDRENSSHPKGMTPLHAIVGGATPEMIEALVEAGADVNARDSIGRTPLMELAHDFERLSGDGKSDGALAEAKALLAAGADATLVDEWGNDAVDHYRFEATRGRIEIEPELLKVLTDAGAKGSEPTLKLFLAIREQNLASVKALIEAGADVNRIAPPHWNATPMMAACGRDRSPQIVEALVRAGADVNRVVRGTTPLIEAAEDGNLAIVKKLLELGADLHQTIVPEKGDESPAMNAYLAAKQRSRHDVVEYLKSLGADKPKITSFKPLEAGVGSWNEYSEILVNADAAVAAEGLAKVTGGKATLNAYGRSFNPGGRAYVVVTPKGMKWCNVFQAWPQRKRWEDENVIAKFARDLSKASGAAVLSIQYSDTSDAASIDRFEPDGSRAKDDGWDRDSLEEIVGAMGDEAPQELVDRLAAMGEEGEDELSSTQRVEQLAKREKFVVAALDIRAEAGRDLEVDFLGYPAEAFDSVAFVSN